MSTQDMEFARRSALYLRSRGLRTWEIESVIAEEFGCTEFQARKLIAA